MSLMMPDGRSWTTPLPQKNQQQPAQQNPVQQFAQKNDQEYGQGQWAFNQAPSPQKAPDMSAYRPGQAQPIPPQGEQNPYANMAPGVYGMDGKQIPGDMGTALNTALQQRAAMAQLVNQNNLKYDMANVFQQDLGAPQLDYGSMMQQAQKMVQDGYYNPFQRYFEEQDALQRIAQQAPPSAYQPPVQQGFPDQSVPPAIDYAPPWMYPSPVSQPPQGTPHGADPILLAPPPKGSVVPQQKTEDERFAEYAKKGLLDRPASYYKQYGMSADQAYFREKSMREKRANETRTLERQRDANSSASRRRAVADYDRRSAFTGGKSRRKSE